ncbi:hypothetical protein B565_0248 [Aeromonas veronii B565]|nr:hypothetical protein B565_0248 [Aeromonas veronii B565]
MGVDHGFSNSRGKSRHPRRSGRWRICPLRDSFATLVLAFSHSGESLPVTGNVSP